MLYEFKPMLCEFKPSLYEFEPLLYTNEPLFHADKPMFYTNILFLLSIFVEKRIILLVKKVFQKTHNFQSKNGMLVKGSLTLYVVSYKSLTSSLIKDSTSPHKASQRLHTEGVFFFKRKKAQNIVQKLKRPNLAIKKANYE